MMRQGDVDHLTVIQRHQSTGEHRHGFGRPNPKRARPRLTTLGRYNEFETLM